MTPVREIEKDSAIGVIEVDSRDELSALHKPSCAAVIWQREAMIGFQDWLDALQPELLPEARVILPPYEVRKAVESICDISGTPDCIERDRLIDDVVAMAEIFARVMDASFLRLRFDVVSTNACRKFHTDKVTARLICTYRGTGTQYGISTDENKPSRIFTVATGAPILLRGKLWPEHPRSGFLHRSPPIEGTGETRLLLVLDPVSNPEKEI